MNCQNINDSRKINVLFTDGFFIVFRSKIQAGYFRVKWNKLTGNEGVKSLTGHRKLWIGCFGELKSEEKLIDKLFWNIFLWSIYNINWLLMIALYYQCSDMGKGKGVRKRRFFIMGSNSSSLIKKKINYTNTIIAISMEL